MTTQNRDDPEIPVKYQEYYQECHQSGEYFDNKMFNNLFEKETSGNSSINASGNSSINASGNSSINASGNSSINASGNSSGDVSGKGDRQAVVSEPSDLKFLPCLSLPYKVIESRDTFKKVGVPIKKDGLSFSPLTEMTSAPINYSDLKFQKIEKLFDDPINFDIDDFNSKFEKHKTSVVGPVSTAEYVSPMSIFGSTMEGALIDLSSYQTPQVSSKATPASLASLASLATPVTSDQENVTPKPSSSLLQDKKFLDKLLKKSSKR
jgi:hypothetical protein